MIGDEKDKKFRPMISFDFDGVMATTNGFKGHHTAGEPIRDVLEAIQKLKDFGCVIIVHSTKGKGIIRDFCNRHNVPVDYINENPEIPSENRGKPVSAIHIDDRALNYHGQSADELLEEIKNFKVYWKNEGHSQEYFKALKDYEEKSSS